MCPQGGRVIMLVSVIAIITYFATLLGCGTAAVLPASPEVPVPTPV